MKFKRKLDIVVISDVHLGTYGCQAKALLTYLNSIEPKHLILNGDIIDIWQFNKNYFPKSHLKIIKKLLSLATKGTKITYITGNHDDMLRKFSDVTFGNISVVDKLLLKIDGKKMWFFHGDVFDASIQHTKWLAKLGGYGYDTLIVINSVVNWFLNKIGKERFSLSKRIKQSVKGAIKHISNFEKTATDLAIENQYDVVVCGHIHQPKKELVETSKGKTLYLNSGDWVENLTALEYQFKRWKLYTFDSDKLAPFIVDEDLVQMSEKDLIAAITIFGNNVKKAN
ncbi:UDP-2,3-diacylglucosamine diphosphatase [Aurantibacter aestuarii]|uniref:UDP-2,3-diacylglucosamine hydrolase n=1 Tax=Aurantibacter aestuarii TaxID=1266046 RepID=A0A2T1NA71_9FLAO|nr:UDP-2,3-diacylglucosamine diphosphatase [Aurantibacter aestuarii]PSG88777.1 UDP-2,3-diacylglucosamine hydrolase [Aurantibacter aestuarii]